MRNRRLLLPALFGVTSLALLLSVGGLVATHSQVSQLKQDLRALREEQVTLKDQQVTTGRNSQDLLTAADDLKARLAKLEAQGKSFDQLTKDAVGYGVCVDTGSSSGAWWVTSIDTPQLLNGAKQCLSGSFVSVVPKAYTP